MLEKVLLKGPLLSQSGYGVHCRQVFKALTSIKEIDLYIQVTAWGNTSWLLSDKQENKTISKILEISSKKNKDNLFNKCFYIGKPDSWEFLGQKNIGITAGFEADLVKESWVKISKKMDAVIVPSEFTKNAFVKTSKLLDIEIKDKIKVINEAYHEYFDNYQKDIKKIYFKEYLDYKKNILIMGQINSLDNKQDRKNTFKTLKAALDFVKGKEIGIVFKVNMGKFSKFQKNHLIDHMKNTFKEEDRKKIKLILCNLDLEKLKYLYTSDAISCLFSGTRGEGWGLSFLESARLGLPIIATNHSAYTEYLEDNFLKINYSKTKVITKDKNFVDKEKNPFWAEFDIDHAILKLEHFFNNEDFYRKQANDFKQKIKQRYNFKVIEKKYHNFFEKV